MSPYAVSINAKSAAPSTSFPGLSFTWRMNLPLPSRRPCGSVSSAPRKKPTLTWAVKASTYANAASPTHAVGWPSWSSSLTSSPRFRTTWNQCRAMTPNACGRSSHPAVYRHVVSDRGRKAHKPRHDSAARPLRLPPRASRSVPAKISPHGAMPPRSNARREPSFFGSQRAATR